MSFESYKQRILSFYNDHRRMPTYAEIMKLIGFKSKNAVYKLVQKMVEDGVVSKDAQGKLVPKRLIGDVPLLGLVEAGFPSIAEQTPLDTLNIDEYLIDRKDATYLLEVKGDSMIDAGICAGDLVVAERRTAARPGDIVIAEVDGGWTMKYYRLKNGLPYLEPANKKYAPIYPQESLQIAAVVRGLVRKIRI